MAKVTVVQVIYNNKNYIRPVFEAIFRQTFKDFEVIAVISGNNDGGKEFLAQNFPQVRIIDPGYNIGFAKGHNMVFKQSRSEFFQLVNPDLILEPEYIEKILAIFDDEKVGAATGKLYQVDRTQISNQFSSRKFQNRNILDTTGVVINHSGRAYDRGQHEEDNGQYDNQTIVRAVSGAGVMFRREALEAVKIKKSEIRISKSEKNLKSGILNPESNFEYFDEDFHSYWEDVDLSWRMSNSGWKCAYVASAVAFHGRAAGSSLGGYKKFLSFINYHRSLPLVVRKLNYKNHILMYIKNSPWFYPQFFVREFFMLGYILLFEPATLKVFPQLLKSIPSAWDKRKIIQNF